MVDFRVKNLRVQCTVDLDEARAGLAGLLHTSVYCSTQGEAKIFLNIPQLLSQTSSSVSQILSAPLPLNRTGESSGKFSSMESERESYAEALCDMLG